MKKLLIFLSLVFSVAVLAAPTPFSPAVWKYLKALDSGKSNGEVVKKIAKATWEVSSTVAASATVVLEGEIPANSIATNVFYYHADTFSASSSNSVSLGCDSADDLVNEVSMDGSATGTSVAGVPDGTVANFVTISSLCNPTITIGAGANGVTNGKVIFFIEYVQVE